MCVAFSADGRGLASSTTAGDVFLWRLATRRPVATYTPPEPVSVLAVAWVSEDVIAAQTRANTITLLRCPTDGAKGPLVAFGAVPYTSYSFCRMCVSRAGDLVVPTHDGGVEAHATRAGTGSGDPVVIAPCGDVRTGSIMFLISLGVSGHLLAGYESGHVIPLDINARQWDAPLQIATEPATCGASWGEASPVAACGCADGTLAVLQWGDDATLSVWKTLTMPKGVADVAFRPDGRVLLAACWDHVVRLVDLGAGGAVLCELSEHWGHTLHAVAYQPLLCPAPLFAVGAADGEISVWNLYN